MQNLSDYIRVYDNVLSKKDCDDIIYMFIEETHNHEKIDNNGRPKFTQLNFAKYFSRHPVFSPVVNAFKQYIDIYQKDTNIGDYQFPNTYAFEEFRVKSYNPEKYERFDLHVDVGDYKSAKRFLAFFFYLNDVEEGGETVFPTLNISIKPKTGRLLIFPPLWMFPHSGMIPISNNKYILGSYLHYL